MQARLSAVQHALIVLLAAALAVAVLARPAPQNARLRRALAELEQLDAHFERAKIERSFLDYARAQGQKPLSDLARATTGKGVPPITAAAGHVEPLASIQIASLAEIKAYAAPARSLPIASAELAQLGPALSLRLARDAQAELPVTLKSVELRAAEVTQADLAIQREAEQLRLEQLSAATTTAELAKKLEAAEQLLEQRRKWKLPWKVISKTNDARKEAKAELDAQKRSQKTGDARYEAAVKKAERPHVSLAYPPLPEYGLAHVELEQAGKTLQYDLPLKLDVHAVPVPSLQGGELREAEAAGLWPEIKADSASAAIAAVRARFNWHYRYVELGGLKVGGMTVLQLLPCILPLLLYFLLRRIRAVSSSYNPFGTQVVGALPRVGFGARMLDGLAVVALPLLAACCAAASLLLIGQVPALPVLAAIVCLLLGGHAFIKLGELQSLMQDVIRSHSHPPHAREQALEGSDKSA